MKNKKIFILILVILLLTGCNDYRELTDMAIISNLGIDKVDEEFHITVQILNSKSNSNDDSKKNSSEVILYNSKGKTIHEALRNTSLESPKKLYVGHLESIIISERIAKSNISELFDFILRDPETTKDANILMIKDASINEVMSIITPLESIPAESIKSSIEVASKIQGSVNNIPFDEFAATIIETGIDPVIPLITIKENKSDNKKVNPEKRIVMSKELAMFSREKFVGYLNRDAAFGYNIALNNVNENVISFKCDKNNYASIELVNNNSKLSYDVSKNTLSIKSTIVGSLSELNCNYNIKKESDVKKLEKKLEKRIEDMLNETIEYAKKYYKSDFLGIERYVLKNDYKHYKGKNYNDLRKNINSNIEVKVKFIQKGSIKKGDEKY